MKQQNVAQVYARALMEISEAKQTHAIQGLETFLKLMNKVSHLKELFFLEIFTREEKLSVFSTIAKKIQMDRTLKDFITFLFNEKRMTILPSLLTEMKALNDEKKGIVRGVVEGREKKVLKEKVAKIEKFLKEKLNKRVQLTYKSTEEVTAGYKVLVGDLLIDISLDGQLRQFRRSMFDGRLK